VSSVRQPRLCSDYFKNFQINTHLRATHHGLLPLITHLVDCRRGYVSPLVDSYSTIEGAGAIGCLDFSEELSTDDDLDEGVFQRPQKQHCPNVIGAAATAVLLLCVHCNAEVSERTGIFF
jgi:hypothetical protein